MACAGSYPHEAMDPLISVIVPVYNVERYLERCLRSLLGQTYRRMEFLLVDDGSTDASGAICDRFAAADNRIRVIHQKNAGVSAARNAGLDAAEGDYIGFCDPDDYIEPDMYEYLFALLLRKDADIAACSGWYEHDKLRRYWFESPPDEISLSSWEAIRELHRRRYLKASVSDKLYRRSVWEKVRFIEGLTNGEDYDAICRILEEGSRIVCGPQAKYHYVQRLSGASSRGYDSDYAKNVRLLLFYKDKYIKEDPAYQRCYENAYICNLMWIVFAMYRNRSYHHPDCRRIKRYICKHLGSFIWTAPVSPFMKIGACVLCVNVRLFGIVCLWLEKEGAL